MTGKTLPKGVTGLGLRGRDRAGLTSRQVGARSGVGASGEHAGRVLLKAGQGARRGVGDEGFVGDPGWGTLAQLTQQDSS